MVGWPFYTAQYRAEYSSFKPTFDDRQNDSVLELESIKPH